MSRLKRIFKDSIKISGKKEEVEIFESQRAKNIRLEIKEQNIRVIIPAVIKEKKKVALKFLNEKKDWIKKKLKEQKKKKKLSFNYSKEEKKKYFKKAKKNLPRLVKRLADKHQFKINNITIRDQKTRWGSCNKKLKNLSLNWRIILLPKILQEYILLHELMHLKYANHSKKYWQELEKILPRAKDYKQMVKRYNIK